MPANQTAAAVKDLGRFLPRNTWKMVATFLVGWMALMYWWAQVSIISALLLFLTLGLLCYVPSRFLIFVGKEELTLSDCAIAVVLGLSALAISSLLALKLGLDLIYGAVVPGSISLALLLKNRKSLHSLVPKCAIDKESLALLGIAMFSFLPTMLQLAYMGKGPWPEVFYNVDFPYYLAHVHSLIAFNSYPPPSLSVAGFAMDYHYGSQAMVASLVRLTGISPHHSFALVVFPLMLTAVVAILFKLSKQYRFTGQRLLFMVLITTFFLVPLREVVIGGMLLVEEGAPINELLYWIGHSWIFDNASQPEMWSTQFAVFVAFAMIFCIANIEQRYNRRMLAYSLGVLLVFKSPWFIGLGVGFALYAFVDLIANKNKTLFVCGLVALLIGSLLYLALPPPGQALKWQFYFAFLFDLPAHWPFVRFVDPDLVKVPIGVFGLSSQFALYLMSLFALKLAFRQGSRMRFDRIHLMMMLLGPFLIVNCFLLRYPSGEKCNDLSQVFSLYKVIIPFLLVHWIVDNLSRLKPIRSRKLMILACYTPVILSALIISTHAANLAINESYIGSYNDGGEYADNRAIAAALRAIPVQNSIIVSNDFSYPAENRRRKRSQFQIPAIYGHQCYACNFTYERNEWSDERLNEQLIFRSDVWEPEALSLAKKHGWTHLLIDRKSPFSKDIPLKLVFENDGYFAYAFPKS